jgi:hypothetical protein
MQKVKQTTELKVISAIRILGWKAEKSSLKLSIFLLRGSKEMKVELWMKKNEIKTHKCDLEEEKASAAAKNS